MNILLFATDFDTPYIGRLHPLLSTNSCKIVRTPTEFFSAVAARVRQANASAIICTCPVTMTTLLSTLPDFKHPVDKRGNKRKLSLDDYAGSCFSIPAVKLGHTNDVQVLILNPLAQLVSTDSGEFIFKRFISKLTAPNTWFPQTRFTFEIWKPETNDSLLFRFREAILLAIDIETYVGDDDRRIHCVGYCGLFSDGTTHSVVVPFKDMTICTYFAGMYLATIIFTIHSPCFTAGTASCQSALTLSLPLWLGKSDSGKTTPAQEQNMICLSTTRGTVGAR